MRKALVVLLGLTLCGCGGLKRTGAILSGWTKTCVEGVSYLQFPSGVTVQYDRSGKIVACE